jgi:hypothetical protein
MSASGAAAGIAVGIVDSISNVAVGVSFSHYEIHAGNSYIADFVDSSMNNDDTIILAFQTAIGTKRVHMTMQFSTLVGGDLRLWEGPTWAAQTGTEIAIINRKREGSMVSSSILADQAQATFVANNVIHANPTGLNTGAATSMHHLYSWGIRNQSSANQVRDVDEIILNAGTRYAAVFTAEGGSNKAHVTLNWYEHTEV